MANIFVAVAPYMKFPSRITPLLVIEHASVRTSLHSLDFGITSAGNSIESYGAYVSGMVQIVSFLMGINPPLLIIKMDRKHIFVKGL